MRTTVVRFAVNGQGAAPFHVKFKAIARSGVAPTELHGLLVYRLSTAQFRAFINKWFELFNVGKS